ncbi:putative xanthine dehydrogenase subunit A [Anatilimnocola aggregata]|uniref:Putative xanthine dehydrogenase subunit A n=1 Tax=Anatilimnocola aggregata TaxID=2528021 RepID=A0A517Y807_9BACT|nr:XdhC/CoxI family protein [Anatilimnocola aggregata]QDU26377.1 putative xanthine dehydrogenase subunit A [Anatilimnocola aggregata]
MRDVVRQLLTALAAGRPAAYCRLVETRGSTPQKAGAVMLVFANGSQAGTLGGGCVEAEVKRRAIALLAEERAELCKFQLDSDYGWDDGLICGGRMLVLIQPITAASGAYFRRLAEMIDAGQGATEAIVYDDSTSGLPAPASYLLDRQGTLLATLNSPTSDLPVSIAQDLKPLEIRPRPYLSAGISYLPVLPRCRLIIVGGGHVGQAVAELATPLDFEVWVVDDRADVVSEARFPHADRRIAGAVDQVLPTLPIDHDTYCLIVTRGHNHDEEALFHVVNRGARYVGLIGSRRKIRLIYDDLLEQGVTREALERVHAPLGIDIGSQTVPEIAVSIAAELVAHRNRDGFIPGRPARVEMAK